jgi:hypothetical protein
MKTTSQNSKIKQLLEDCTPKAFQNLLSLMVPDYLSSEVFKSYSGSDKNHETLFLMDLWDLFNLSEAEIIKQWPEFLSQYSDLQNNRELIKSVFAVHLSSDDYSPATGFDDTGFETFGIMALIDCFREPFLMAA